MRAMRTGVVLVLLGAAASAAPPGYVEPAACRPCHQQLYDRYLETPMGRSFHRTADSEPGGDWEDATFHHEASGRSYEMFRRGDRRYVRRYVPRDGGRELILEREVTHVIGSGERAISLAHQTKEGRLFELPVSWYPQEQRWAMAPGYDRPGHPGFSRLINHKCMFCHNAYPDTRAPARPGWDADVLFPVELPSGIDCQRCHGPGARHAETADATDVVNPAKLSAERSLETCMQCHYETTTFRLPDSIRRPGRSFYSYKPGEPLEDYAAYFDHAPGKGWDEKFEIVSAAYRLRQSRCFLESQGRMTCLDCHNPHDRPEQNERPDYYRQRCVGCHAAPAAHLSTADLDCVSCHMPRRRTEDVVHVVMTDHKIVRRPPAEDLLAPMREKTEREQTYRGEVVPAYPDTIPSDSLLLAVAQVKDRANLKDGVRRLQALLDQKGSPFPDPWFELAEALRALERDEEAETAYRRALEAAADHPQAWNNLANLLADGGRTEEAVEAYERALELTPWDAQVRVNLGLTLLEAGRPEEALAAFERAVEADPTSADAHANLGAFLLSVGDEQPAQLSLETALTLDPALKGAQANLDLLGKKKGRGE